MEILNIITEVRSYVNKAFKAIKNFLNAKD